MATEGSGKISSGCFQYATCMKATLIITTLILAVFAASAIPGVIGIVGQFSIAPAWMSNVTAFLTLAGSITMTSVGALATLILFVITTVFLLTKCCYSKHSKTEVREEIRFSQKAFGGIKDHLSQLGKDGVAPLKQKLKENQYCIVDFGPDWLLIFPNSESIPLKKALYKTFTDIDDYLFKSDLKNYKLVVVRPLTTNEFPV